MPTPEELAREEIDALLLKCGWVIQDYKKLDLSADRGIAIREVRLKEGRCDYLLLIDRKLVGIIEAKNGASRAAVTLMGKPRGRLSQREGVKIRLSAAPVKQASASLIRTSSANIRTSAPSPMASTSATSLPGERDDSPRTGNRVLHFQPEIKSHE